MTRNLAKLRVSYELLKELLSLPAGTVIRRVQVSPMEYAEREEVELIVEHPDLLPVAEGCVIPETLPTYRSVGVRFDGWGERGKR